MGNHPNVIKDQEEIRIITVGPYTLDHNELCGERVANCFSGGADLNSNMLRINQRSHALTATAGLSGPVASRHFMAG